MSIYPTCFILYNIILYYIILGEERLSLVVRFVDTTNQEPAIRYDFLVFTSLAQMDAETIANTLIAQCTKFGLDLTELLGQGYDGCPTMSDKVGGLQSKIMEKNPEAAFVHIAAHRLNLVVNDLNSIAEVHNAIGTVKTIITFFRECPKNTQPGPKCTYAM